MSIKRSLLACMPYGIAALAACGGPGTYVRRDSSPPERWTTQICYQMYQRTGERAVLTRENGRWRLAPRGVEPGHELGVERLLVDHEKRLICVDAPQASHKGHMGCTLNAFSSKDDKNREHAGYLACNSELATCRFGMFDWTILYPMINFVLGGDHDCEPSPNNDEIWKAVEDSNLFAALKARAFEEQAQALAEAQREAAEQDRNARANAAIMADVEVRTCRALFAAAATARRLAELIQRCEARDPDGLVPKARAQLGSQLAEFRQGLDTGMRTNCGVVVQTRKSAHGMVVQVETEIVGTHWFPADKLWPPGADCRFVNKVYQPPYPF